MSDETPPPPLRLKPRARPEGEISPPVPADATPAAATAAESTLKEVEAPKLRLRPKLETTAEPVAPAPSAPEPASPPSATPATPFSLKPRLKPEPSTASAPATPPNEPAPSSLSPQSFATESAPPPVEPPKFKLKEKIPEAPVSVAATISSSPVATPPPPPPPPAFAKPVPPTPVAAAPSSASPPPFPVVASPSVNPAASLPPPTPKSTTKEPAENDASTDTADYGRTRFAKILLYVAGFVVVIAVVVGALFGYRKLKSTPPAPAPTAVAEAPKRPSTPSATLNELSTIPARTLNKAKETIAAVNEKEETRMDPVLNGEGTSAPLPRRNPPPKPAPKPVAPVTSTTQLAPGITATTTAGDVTGDASPAFRNWVAQAKVSGVFQGSTPRALINGRTVAAGQIVDETLGITFDGIDSVAKTLVFRDRTGVTVVRKF